MTGPSHIVPRACTAVVLAAFVLLLGSGCETEVVAVTGTDRPYSLFGLFSPQTDTQRVLVFPIEGTLEPLPPAPLEARVTSLDLTTGETRTWIDSLDLDARGQVAHVFWSPFAAEFGHAYRLTVARADGATTTVEAIVPPLTSLVLPPQQEQAPALLGVEVVGAAPHLIRVEVTYAFKYATVAGIERARRVVVYDGRQRATSQGWSIPLTVVADLRAIQSALRAEGVALDAEVGLKLMKLTLRLIVADVAWDPPGGVFDAEILVQPGTLTNVENGFGFVGAGYRLQGTWVPLDTLILGL